MAVKIIERQGKAALVAWMDGDLYKRVTIPANKLVGNDVSPDVLAQGVAYGLNWEDILSGWPGADILANEFRRQGIWTAEDFWRGAASVRGAINRIFVAAMMDELLDAIRGE